MYCDFQNQCFLGAVLERHYKTLCWDNITRKCERNSEKKNQPSQNEEPAWFFKGDDL